MSDANREQLTSLLGDLWSDWKEAVAADRRLAPADIQRVSDEQGMLNGTEALKAGLVDRLATPDAVLDELKSLAGRKPSGPALRGQVMARVWTWMRLSEGRLPSSSSR